MAMNGIILKDVAVSEADKTVIPIVSFRSVKLKKERTGGVDVIVANVEVRIGHSFEEVIGVGRDLEKREIYLEKKSGDLSTGMEIDGDVVNNKWKFSLKGRVGDRKLGAGNLALAFSATKVGPGSGIDVAKKSKKKAVKKK